MKLKEMWEKGITSYTVELLPPRKSKDHQERVYTTKELERLRDIGNKGKDLCEIIDGISVTEGAGGKSSRFGTKEVAKAINGHLEGKDVITHLTCVGSTRKEVETKVEEYLTNGIDNILALKGDQPKNFEGKVEFEYATDLVRFLRGKFGEKVNIGVAAHPEGYDKDKGSYGEKIEWSAEVLKQKQDAGADYAITQMIFDINVYDKFIEKTKEKGVEIPIIPGVFIPNSNAKKTVYEQCKFAEEKCNVRIPFIKELEGKTKEEQEEIVYENMVKLCRNLYERGVKGIHLFTLNNVGLQKKF